MDNEQQSDSKRPRIGTGPGPWPIEQPNQPNPSRALPHPLQPPYTNSPFARSEPHSNPLDRRPPHSNYQEHLDPHRPNSGHSHVYHNIHTHPPIPPFNAHNGSREPMVKPDPSEELPQHRPPPISNGAEHHVNQPYPDDRGRPPFAPKFDPPPPPQPPQFSMYPSPNAPPPSTSPMATPTYDSPVQQMYATPGAIHQSQPREAYSVAQYSQAAKPRKAQRAAQACDSCRSLKAKCDEGRPACGSCKEKSSECHYRDPPPKAVDKASTDILQGLYLLQEETKKFHNMLEKGIQDLSDRMDRVEENQARLSSGAPMRPSFSSLPAPSTGLKQENSEDVSMPEYQRPFTATGASHDPQSFPDRSEYTQTPTQAQPDRSEYTQTPTQAQPDRSEYTQTPTQAQPDRSEYAQTPTQAQPDRSEYTQTPTQAQPDRSEYAQTPTQAQPDRSEYAQTPTQAQPDVGSTPEEEEDEESGDIVPPGEAMIPVNHTTSAARLLLVENIRDMIEGGGGFPKKVKDEKYTMLQEERRGLLRLFGRGEGTDLANGYDRDPLMDHGSESTPNDVGVDVGSPRGEEWGQLGGMTPPHSTPEYTPRVIGQINSDGMPDFRRHTVMELAKSFNENINIMHPLLPPKQLERLVESFLKSIPADSAKPKAVQSLQSGSNAGFVGARAPESPGNKRKRSPGAEGPLEVFFGHGVLKPGHPSRSISTALVLVILALGRICQDRGKLPELPSDRDDQGHINSPVIRNGHPSPIHSSPSYSPELPSPQDGGDRIYNRSRRTSMEFIDGVSRSYFRPRNVDVIPGLAYFALATDIIGNQLGGNSLQHVHVNILAGLYHGQMARVLESHAYISSACRALQVILRPKLDRFKKLKQTSGVVPEKDNPLIIAFWSCLQLESDILAELPCPHSGILAYEEDMPSPNLQASVDVDHFSREVVMHYSQQLHARKHLNQLHNIFYNPETALEFRTGLFVGEKAVRYSTIEAMESNLHALFPYILEHDDLPTDVLGARRRAKFFGAEVITYRNFIIRILQHSHEIESQSKGNIQVLVVNANGTAKEIHPKALAYARRGLIALVHSTTAFHGLGEGRLIVTNIWGTAHAQFGNLLVLQAAWSDKILGPLLVGVITGDELQRLLVRTLRFLGLVATRSSSLYTDIKILVSAGKSTKLLNKEVQARDFLVYPQPHMYAGSFSAGGFPAGSVSAGSFSASSTSS